MGFEKTSLCFSDLIIIQKATSNACWIEKAPWWIIRRRNRWEVAAQVFELNLAELCRIKYITKACQYITICYKAAEVKKYKALLWLREHLTVNKHDMLLLADRSSGWIMSFTLHWTVGSSEALQPFTSDTSCRGRALGHIPLLHKLVPTFLGQPAEVVQRADEAQSQAWNKSNQWPENQRAAAILLCSAATNIFDWGFGVDFGSWCRRSHSWQKKSPRPPQFSVAIVLQDARIKPFVRFCHAEDA